MTNQLRVAIIGAGLAGLLLCRALRRSGIDAQIYERESQKNARFEGYRLGLSELGQEAVKRAVSEDEWESFQKLMERKHGTGGLAMVDPKSCDTYWDWSEYPSEPAVRLIPRSVLRDFLLSNLDEGLVHYSKAFESFELIGEGDARAAQCNFADGTHDVCDIIVGADGANSRVKLAVGLDNKVDTKIRCLLLYSRLSRSSVEAMPTNFVTRYWMALLERYGMFISPWLPQIQNQSENRDTGNGGSSSLDGVDWANANLALGIFGCEEDFSAKLGPASSRSVDGKMIKECFASILKEGDADERLLSMAEGAVEQASQFVKFTCCSRPPNGWAACSSDVPCVLIGDSLHSMPPTRGMGGNLALADAADLANYLIQQKGNDRTHEFWRQLTSLQNDISERGFSFVGSSVFWAKQYMNSGHIFQAYKDADVSGREEMEADLRYGFQDNASTDAIRNIFSA